MDLSLDRAEERTTMPSNEDRNLAIQVNMRGGRLPEPEANGVSYLKLPLNQF